MTEDRDLLPVAPGELFHLASEQAGYFTAAQAKTLGYSYQAQAHHTKAGNWLRIDRGLFRLAEWIPDVNDDLVRWTLWSGGRGVISHETALAAHGIGQFESPKVHLTVPVGFRKRDPAVTLHHSGLSEDDVVQRVGFRVTTPVRSIIDVSALSPDEDQLARSIEDARRSGLLTIRSLRNRSEIVDPRAALNIERAIQRTTAS